MDEIGVLVREIVGTRREGLNLRQTTPLTHHPPLPPKKKHPQLALWHTCSIASSLHCLNGVVSAVDHIVMILLKTLLNRTFDSGLSFLCPSKGCLKKIVK